MHDALLTCLYLSLSLSLLLSSSLSIALSAVLDVASNRKILHALLTSIGVKEVDTAGNGQEAVQAALAPPQKYDLILMDNIMPIMVSLACLIARFVSVIATYTHTWQLAERIGGSAQAARRGVCEAGGGGDGQYPGR